VDAFDDQISWSIAVRILQLFQDYRSAFRSISAGARQRFETAHWQDAEAASQTRIRLYSELVQSSSLALSHEVSSFHSSDWQRVRQHYQHLIQGADDEALAKTVYNSIYRKLAGRIELDDDRAFLTLAPSVSETLASTDVYRFETRLALDVVLERILLSYPFAIGYQDLTRDVALASQRMQREIPALRGSPQLTVSMLRPVFYRNKGAYLIGHLEVEQHRFPLAFAIQRESDGLVLDTVLWNERDLSLIFSFTRAYFMVDLASPAPFVAYLNTLMPTKKTAELYTSLGYFKHGKTVFIDELNRHLRESPDRFEQTPGIPGLVMEVFQLRSFQVVFKVIKDRFPSSKKVTREQVRAAYHLVKTHDRVGRMADTHEFFELRLPTSLFDADLLERMLTIASKNVSLAGDEVILHHVYVERLMTPLNLYLLSCNDTDRRFVLEDFGEAIKQLASANIFPGDMLPKNFGVTRHGRVVFYDYDEICYLTDVNFRALPESDPENVMGSSDAFLSVGEQDVFPEQFKWFLFPEGVNQREFWSRHPEIADSQFWQSVQSRVRTQEVLDIYPYRWSKRLKAAAQPSPEDIENESV